MLKSSSNILVVAFLVKILVDIDSSSTGTFPKFSTNLGWVIKAS